MRADRLVAALLYLQARGQVTAAELAAELEVSVATARRDLEALSTAGIPVYPQPGRGGGWSLVGGARTTMIDATRWGERERHWPAMVDVLQTAVIRRRQVRLSYLSHAGERSERLIDPWGLVDKDDIWYLVAGTDRGQRTFRVDRISAAEPTGLPAKRPPDGVTLASAWSEVVGEVEKQRSRTWATVLIQARFVPVLHDHFGRHFRVDGDAGGRMRHAGGMPESPVVNCVLLWARPGMEAALSAYEDKVLRLVAEHGGRVLQRGTVLPGSQNDGDPPTEVQFLEMPSEASLDAYVNDPRRLAMAAEREAAIARTDLFRIQPVPPPAPGH